MNKTEVLNELEKRIRVLEKNEITDILNEYSQHIDMRMENGLSEPDAIKDFGNMDDLAAEILEAYHVNPEYEKEKAVSEKGGLKKAGSAAAEAFVPAAEKVKGFFAAVGRQIKRFFLKLWSLIISVWLKIKGLFKKKDKTDTEPAESGQIEAANVKKRKITLKKPGIKNTGKVKGRCRKMFSGFLFVCLAVIVILCLIPVSIGGLFSIFGLGTSIVLMIQGYPVAGIFIVCLGCSVLSVSLWLLLASLLIRKKSVTAAVKEAETEEEYEAEDTAEEVDEQ